MFGPRSLLCSADRQRYKTKYAARRRRKNNNLVDTKFCDDFAIDEEVELVVADDNEEILAVAAQDDAYGAEDEELILTVRLNGEPEK